MPVLMGRQESREDRDAMFKVKNYTDAEIRRLAVGRVVHVRTSYGEYLGRLHEILAGFMVGNLAFSSLTVKHLHGGMIPVVML